MKDVVFCLATARDMEGARAVGARFPIPPIAVAGYPAVDPTGEAVYTWNFQQPGYGAPAGQRAADFRPRIHPAQNAPVGIDCLHQAQRLLHIDLREAIGNDRVVQIDERDSMLSIPATDAVRARSAQRAVAIVENR